MRPDNTDVDVNPLGRIIWCLIPLGIQLVEQGFDQSGGLPTVHALAKSGS